MMKAAKLASQARLPAQVRPAATPTRLDSAMPTLKKRSGNFLAKKSVRVELCTSPSTTTMSGNLSPTCAKARPKASRTDLPCLSMEVSRGKKAKKCKLQKAICKLQIYGLFFEAVTADLPKILHNRLHSSNRSANRSWSKSSAR